MALIQGLVGGGGEQTLGRPFTGVLRVSCVPVSAGDSDLYEAHISRVAHHLQGMPRSLRKFVTDSLAEAEHVSQLPTETRSNRVIGGRSEHRTDYTGAVAQS